MPKSFYVTTPIFYVNDAPHIGHAYTEVAADVITRWHRQRGEGAFLLTGTDEHGEKVLRTAIGNNSDPKSWTDRLVNDSWLPLLETIDIANQDFIRTTEERHKVAVQKFLQQLYDAGYIYQGSFQGNYCVGCEEYKNESDLIDGSGEFAGQRVCAIHSKPVEQLNETNYFFKLSDFSDRLLEHYERHPEAIQPRSAYNEVMSFIRQGLVDISMSRSSVSWGIPLAWDAQQVTYVWFDALLNYATAVGYGAEPGTPDAERFARVWPPDVNLVGKDILRFHAVYWPAMLMAAGLEPPRKVFAHGWLLVGGEKMSKSKLTGIAPEQIIDTFGSDAFRYYFLRAIQFGQDGSFSWEDMHARYTAELANGLGNLASRGTAMVVRYRDGALPAGHDLTDAERRIVDALSRTVEIADPAFCDLDFSTGIVAVKEFIDLVNLYVTEQEPWVLAKDDAQSARLDVVLATICESLRAIAVLYNPLMPKAMSSLWEQLGAQAQLGPLAEQRIADVASWGQLPAGTRVTKGESLFPRIEEA